MSYTFKSTTVEMGHLPDFTEDQIKNEPMLFSCDRATSRKLGGPITHAFLDELERVTRSKYAPDFNGDDFILDTRSHMLMPGWFPCIPGYHHDDVPRSTPTGQPNYDTPEYHSQHVMALINGDICPTEFVLGLNIEMPEVPAGEVIYKVWHKELEMQVRTEQSRKLHGLHQCFAPSNTLVFFDWQTFHQGTKAVKVGWRWFARASVNTHRKPMNELRRQVQVYMENPMEGW